MSVNKDGHAQRETTPGYWDDPRWVQVAELRKLGKHPEANHLVFEIRASYNVD